MATSRESVTVATDTTQLRYDTGGKPTVDAKGPADLDVGRGPGSDGGGNDVPSRNLRIRRIN